MIDWTSIKDALPDDPHAIYLVTDGNEVATTEVSGIVRYINYPEYTFKFDRFTGCPNTEYSGEVEGRKELQLNPTHWAKIDKSMLPKI